MTFLALETSSIRGSLALCAGEVCVGEVLFSEGLLHGREIARRAEDLLAESGRTARDLEAVAVSLGPGSFTGLRVGVTAAKTLAFALRVGVVGESSLRVIAAGLLERKEGTGGPEVRSEGQCDAVLLPVLDGRRHTYFAAAFTAAPPGDSDRTLRILPDGLFGVDALLDALGRVAREGPEGQGVPGGSGRPVIVLGDGADAFLREVEAPSRGGSCGAVAGLSIVRGPAELDLPRASVLGRLVAGRVATARFETEEVHRLEPAYLRLSDAEIRRRGS
jgi:tRNA threonylcarbamoyladenosine biosynthesis protein TsaB